MHKSGFTESDSRLSIVAKNLPLELTENGVINLFSRIGKVEKVFMKKLSPGRKSQFSHALIIYQGAEDAKKAIYFFDDFKIGGDGPTLRVSVALTKEEKQTIRRNKAIERNLIEDIKRNPGLPPSRFMELPKTSKATEEGGPVETANSEVPDTKQEQADLGSASDEEYVSFRQIRKFLPLKQSENADHYGNCLPPEAVPDFDDDDDSDDGLRELGSDNDSSLENSDIDDVN